MAKTKLLEKKEFTNDYLNRAKKLNLTNEQMEIDKLFHHLQRRYGRK